MPAGELVLNWVMDKSKYTVAIIAGGRSRRFGSSKSKAIIDGQTLLDRALELARRMSDQVILIVNGPSAINDSSIAVYEDIIKGKGPIAGIHSALTYCQTSWLAVMPVDMPFLDLRVYQYLSPYCTHENPVAAESDAGLEPLVSFWPRSVLSAVENFLQDGDLGLYQCLNKLKAQRINCSQEVAGFEPRIFTNINRPEDLIK